MSTRILAARKQPSSLPRDPDQLAKRLKRQIREGHLGNPVRCLRIWDPDYGILQINLLFLHRHQFLVDRRPVSVMIRSYCADTQVLRTRSAAARIRSYNSAETIAGDARAVFAGPPASHSCSLIPGYVSRSGL